MRVDFSRSVFGAAILAASLLPGIHAQTVDPAYSASYTIFPLGTVTGTPLPYGGLVFSAASNNVILLGAGANTLAGHFYSVPVVRGSGGHITSFGAPTVTGFGKDNDGGIAYGPNGALLYAEYPIGSVGEVVAGANVDNRTVLLSGIGFVGSPGPLNFVPTGLNGAGQLKIAAYNNGGFYNVTYALDGTGTYNLTAATLIVTLPGGPEGIAYVPAGSTLFPSQSLLIAEYGTGQISSYTTDSNGNPVLASRHAFITGLTGRKDR